MKLKRAGEMILESRAVTVLCAEVVAADRTFKQVDELTEQVVALLERKVAVAVAEVQAELERRRLPGVRVVLSRGVAT